MGCPSEVNIGDNLVFSICTHDPDTGVLTDADSAPSYRVYEDETGTAILTGSMAKLDDANTTGFYTELIACTSANGFEDGKTYTVYIAATVDSDTGGICYGFKAITPIWDKTVNESSVGATPTTSGTKLQAIWNYLFCKRTVTSSLETAYESDSSTAMETWDLTDDGTTATKAP